MATAFGNEGPTDSVRRGDALGRWIGRHPVGALVLAVVIIFALWLVLAPWPPGFEDGFRKEAPVHQCALQRRYPRRTLFSRRHRLHTDLRPDAQRQFGARLALPVRRLHGLRGRAMDRVVVVQLRGRVCFCAIVGIAMQFLIFRRMEGEDLRQTLVTLGLSIVFSDLMVWVWGGNAIQIDTPDYLLGPVSDSHRRRRQVERRSGVSAISSRTDGHLRRRPRHRHRYVARASPHAHRRDDPRRRRRSRHAFGAGLPRPASLRHCFRLRRRTRRNGRHRRWHVSIDLARRGLRTFCWRRCKW